MKHIVLATALNVRAEPNTSSVIQAVLPRFAIVEEVEATSDRGWIKIFSPGYRGWCSNGFLLRQEVWEQPIAQLVAMEFGIGEVAGPIDNPRIVEYQKTIVGANVGDEVSWCSSFIHWSVAKHTGKRQPNITASARSWKSWGTAANAVEPVAPGCIAVLWRRNDKADIGKTAQEVAQDGASGHVAVLAEPFSKNDKQITLLGGNQGNRVSKVTYPIGESYGVLGFRAFPPN